MLEKHQLTGPNFNEWLRALKLVVRTEKLQDVFETPLPPAPAASADNQALADWNALFDRHNEVACLMLGTMSPKLYQQFENKSPQEMITELQKMYGKPLGVELQELVNMFHSLSISFILNSLSSEFQAFVQNYNMQSMEKTTSEVHSLLIEFKKSIKRNKQQIVGASSTPHVMAIQSAELMKKKKTGGQNVASTSSVSMNNMIYFNAITVNGIYEIDMRDSTLPIVNSMYSISNKRTKPNLDSSYLWHCRLAHINKKRIEKLQHDGLLKPTDNELFDQCLTPPYTPQHNGVSERRNRSLLNMVRSMMSLTTLPLSFWDYALESAARILNMVPTKKVDKTPYELWHGKVPNLSYLKVWGCEAHV
ncbi:retrotransposon protein, putative, ty1-copia subclass [Tanacetum coccineum]